MTEKKVMKLATRGKRLGAACIDTIVPAIAYAVYSAVLGINLLSPYPPGYGYGNDFGFGYGYGYGYDYGINRLSGASAAIVTVVSLLVIAYAVAELILFAKGKSIGKALLGLQVVSSKDGKPFRFWKMVFRECFVKAASGSVFGLGYIWVLLDEKNRGWHDKILDSYVVDIKESEKMNLGRHTAKPDETQKRLEEAGIRKTAPETGGPESAEEEAILIETAEVPVPVTAEAAATEAEESVAAVADEDEEAPESGSEEAAAEAEIPETDETAVTAKELSMSMKKEELLQAARELGVDVSARATKAAIIEAVEKAKSTEEND